MERALIHGCFNTTNFGDLLLAELIAKYLLEKWNIETETIRLLKDVPLEYCKQASVGHIIKPKYAIYGGGGYLHDSNGNPRITKRLLRYTLPAKVWKTLRIPYSIIGPGGGPYAVGTGAERIKFLCNNASHITIRDNQTVELLRNIGVNRNDIVTTADLALTITSDDIPVKYRFDMKSLVGDQYGTRKILGMHLERVYEEREIFEKFCKLPFLKDPDFLSKFHIVFFYDYKSNDAEWVEQKIDQIENLSYSIVHRMNHWLTADLIRQFDAMVSTKLHVSIVSVAFGVPVFGYSYHQKSERFYREIGRGQFQKMWTAEIACINDWMMALKNNDYEAWNLDPELMATIKKKAAANYDVLDAYLRSRTPGIQALA